MLENGNNEHLNISNNVSIYDMITIMPSTELINIGGFSVQTWGFIVAIGMIVSLVLMLKEAKRKKVLDNAESLIAYIAIASIIGARLAYIALNPSEFSDIISIFEIWKGGVISWGFCSSSFFNSCINVSYSASVASGLSRT